MGKEIYHLIGPLFPLILPDFTAELRILAIIHLNRGIKRAKCRRKGRL